MKELPHVVIVMARCSKSKRNFGIRFEKTGRRQWTAKLGLNKFGSL